MSAAAARQPIALLHHAHISGGSAFSLLGGDDGSTPVTDPREATAAMLKDPHDEGKELRFDITAPSGFKEYDLRTILLFYLSRDAPFGDYLKAVSADAQSVNFMDRKELLTLLENKTSSVGKEQAAGAAKRPLQEDSKADDSAKRPKLVLSAKDIELAKNICARERTLTDYTTCLSLNSATKNFAAILDMTRKQFADRPKKPQPAPSSQQRSGAPNPARDARADPRARPSSASRPNPERPRPGGADARIPIIIVPSVPTAKLTLWNAKQFFGESTYVRTEQFVEAGQPKPPKVVFERKLSPNHPGGPNFPKIYHVVDSPDSLKPEDWYRVVAAFVTGQGWQFTRWKYKDPVVLFSKLRGFCLKYVDEPAPGDVNNWAVTKLDIHRSLRHNDWQAINKFWEQVDKFILREKKRQFMD
ncbi:RNA pol II accessory factor, Cdc73 family-domain-containing protein [Phlyctochytrium arcticum]|nr:RNA pol II accessory factor, Cdc73 family-domain-containing protein [Phlyctochytrium arcticum]